MSSLADNIKVKFLVVLLATISPFLCILIHGELHSYSQYWTTDLRPLFIFTNAATSYFLFSSRSWWLSSAFLLFLTAFSYDQYLWAHNISAIAFFISSGVAIIRNRKYQYYILPYFSSLIVLVSFGILWAEVCGILVICAFHFHRLVKYNKIEKKRKLLNL